MKILSKEFVKGVVGSEGLPRPILPTVAFFGRSNVGKSSTINALLDAKKLAISSVQPGRTTEINYFIVNEEFYCADLPGYGYARASLQHREKIRRLVLWFLSDDVARVDLAICIIDGSIGLKDVDREAIQFAFEHNRKVAIIANKMDKGSQNKNRLTLKSVQAEYPEVTIFPFSAKMKIGRDEVLAVIKKELHLSGRSRFNEQ
ncbi:MAG: GTP-binding protein [Patescibacteria group bacterium]|jgi:GTP-binding protein|nr:GTP-binding protein [Patescibacteria group bacterium]